jgi:arylsulfatase
MAARVVNHRRAAVLVALGAVLLLTLHSLMRVTTVNHNLAASSSNSIIFQELLPVGNTNTTTTTPIPDSSTAATSTTKTTTTTTTTTTASTTTLPETIASTTRAFPAATTATTATAQQLQQPHKPLNILILYPDDWRHDTIGSAATQPVKTPFLDALASEGMRFTHNCVTTSICWVSRATLFSGQYASRHRSLKLKEPNFQAPEQWKLSWPSLLRQQAGYYTGHVGKWQFYSPKGFFPREFDFAKIHEGHHWYGKEHASDRAARDALDFLKHRPRDKPFAMTVAFYPPKAVGNGATLNKLQYKPTDQSLLRYHNVTVDEPMGNIWNETTWSDGSGLPDFFVKNIRYNEGRKRFKTRMGLGPAHYQASMTAMYACITDVDRASERIVNELKQQGIENETLIIFTADNGLYHGEHGLSGKWYPHQESIRVPLIIKDPRMPANRCGTLDDSFTLNIDLASTILAAANVQQPERMQGSDIANLYLTTPGGGGDNVVWRQEFYYEHRLSQFGRVIPQSSALVRKEFKYMYWPDGDVEQLFDLRNDPLERHDLAGVEENKERLDEMRKQHDVLNATVL